MHSGLPRCGGHRDILTVAGKGPHTTPPIVELVRFPAGQPLHQRTAKFFFILTENAKPDILFSFKPLAGWLWCSGNTGACGALITGSIPVSHPGEGLFFILQKNTSNGVLLFVPGDRCDKGGGRRGESSHAYPLTTELVGVNVRLAGKRQTASKRESEGNTQFDVDAITTEALAPQAARNATLFDDVHEVSLFGGYA